MIESTIWKGVEGVMLDAVGTLIEPQPSVGEVYLAAAARQGVFLESKEVKSRFYRHFRNDELDETLGPMITNEDLKRKRWKRIVKSVLHEVPDPDLAFEELWNHFAQPRHWRCFTDVAAALKTFKAVGLKVCVASNFDGRLRGVVEGTPELVDLRDSLAISSLVEYRKPHETFYKAAAAVMGLSPESVLSIGDDLENDVVGPSRVGLRAILLDRSGGGSLDWPSARDLNEVIQSYLDHRPEGYVMA